MIIPASRICAAWTSKWFATTGRTQGRLSPRRGIVKSGQAGFPPPTASFAGGLFLRPARFLDRPVPVLAKCKTDKSEHHQDGPGYHQPMGKLHVGEDAQGRLTFSPWANRPDPRGIRQAPW